MQGKHISPSSAPAAGITEDSSSLQGFIDINVMAKGVAMNALGFMGREQRLARANKTQPVGKQPVFQKKLWTPVAGNFFPVSSGAQGGLSGIRTIHRANGRSRAIHFGQLVFMQSDMIDRAEGSAVS
jgi:hypothetical protein